MLPGTSPNYDRKSTYCSHPYGPPRFAGGARLRAKLR